MRRPNIWPEKHVPQLRLVFQALGQLMAIVGERVAALCDLYMAQKVHPIRIDPALPSCSPCCCRYQNPIHRLIATWQETTQLA